MPSRCSRARQSPNALASAQPIAEADAPPETGAAEDTRRSQPSHLLDQFSDRAKKALTLAEDEARQRNHSEIRPEHLRLALLTGREVGIPELRIQQDKDLVALRDELDARLGRGEQPVSGALTLTDGCKRVLQLAIEEMARVRAPQVSPEHLQIGLVAEGSGIEGGTMTALALRGLRMAMGVRPSGRYRPQDAVGVVNVGAPSGTRDNVVTLRIGDDDLAAIDTLVEIGVARTRSEGAAWLLHAGIGANASLYQRARGLVAEIRRLRDEAQQLAQEHVAGSAELAPIEPATADPALTEPATAESGTSEPAPTEQSAVSA